MGSIAAYIKIKFLPYIEMREVTKEQVATCLNSLGIRSGDGLLVHSAVQYLGRPQGGLGMYLAAIQAVIGPEGTVVVPTFNFAFAKGERYDPRETPSQGMGAFSEYVRQLPEAQRTAHPMQSVAVLGRYAADLASRDTPSAFDPSSAFERMLELDFKLLLLGADSRATSMFHYCEQRANVPYRYWKDFTGEVRTPEGWQTRTYRMFARDLELNPQLTLDPVVAYLEARGQWKSTRLNYGHITVCRLADFVSAAGRFLTDNPWSLVLNRPDNR
jgi:aminoglycoside 3-N-acetyltransferase